MGTVPCSVSQEFSDSMGLPCRPPQWALPSGQFAKPWPIDDDRFSLKIRCFSSSLYLDLHHSHFFVQQFSLGFTLVLTFYAHLNQTMHICFLTDGYLCYFPGYLLISREKTAHNFGFNMHKVQTCEKWWNYMQLRSCGEKPLRKQTSLK